jgi:ribosomal protein S18 acetylase RimI-like enzyme
LGAQRFYETLGFEKRALLRSYYQDGEDGLLMERSGIGRGELPDT